MTDLLPYRFDTRFRPGVAYTLRLTGGTAGWLDDYSFTASLGGTALVVTEDGDDLVIAISSVITTAKATPEWSTFLLTEAANGVVVTGRWEPSLNGTLAPDSTVPIVLGAIEIPLTLLIGPAGAGGGGGGAVDSVNGQTGVVVLDAADVGAASTAALASETATRAAADTALDGRLDIIEAISIATDGELAAAIAALSTVYQPLDSDLTAIAALATTAYGRAFLALADAAAGRTALGLGTAATAATGDFDAAGAAAAAQAASQPLDSDLTAIAALTTTGFGRGLLALADAAALRTTLNVEDGATADQTAAEILAALLTVDGAGSGLDADLLDGQSSAAFETPAGAQTKVDALEDSLREIQVSAGLTSDVSVPGVQTIGRSGVDIQVFTASGTYTKPAGATAIQVICIGGGGGGGSGRKGAAGTDRFGGGAGRGGMTSEVWLDPADVSSSETVTIGVSGTGGAAVTANSTDGNVGIAGGTTLFGSLVTATGGNRGQAGTATTGIGGGDALDTFVAKRGSYRVGVGASSSVSGTPTAADGGHTGSGGAGGGISSANTARAGGNSSGGSGGAAATGGAAGASGAAGGTGVGSAGGGGGSGGGAASGGTVGTGGAGGAGGGGGGGGGAGIDSTTDSGAGGAGGVGRCVVLTYR